MSLFLFFSRRSKGKGNVVNDSINLMGIENYIERKGKKEKGDIYSALDEGIPLLISNISLHILNTNLSYFSSQIIPPPPLLPPKDNIFFHGAYFQTYRSASISKSNNKGKLLISRMKFFV